MSDRSHPPGNPPSSPPPPTPRPNDPTHPGREMTVVQRDEYRISLLLNGRPVATAIRTLWGWHIPRSRNKAGELAWLTANTVRGAIARMRAVAAGLT